MKIVGKPTSRIEGPLKVTGKATYAYEWHEEVPKAAYGFVVGSAIAKGRITSIDLHGAKTAPGVIAVLTASEAGSLQQSPRNIAKLLGGPEVQEHYHQAIGIVVAETFEQARTAAQRLNVKYSPSRGHYDLAASRDSAVKPQGITGGPPDTAYGDFAERIQLGARHSGCHLHDP